MNVTHNISPSSGSLPSEASILVSFTACLAFFLAFFPCKKRNNDQVEKNPSISDKRKEEGYSGDAIQNIISHPRTTTGQQTPDTRTSMLRPNLFICETASTVQDSLNGTGPIWKHHFYLTSTITSPHFSTLRTVCFITEPHTPTGFCCRQLILPNHYRMTAKLLLFSQLIFTEKVPRNNHLQEMATNCKHVY